jgi:protein-tyrosine phosphatase
MHQIHKHLYAAVWLEPMEFTITILAIACAAVQCSPLSAAVHVVTNSLLNSTAYICPMKILMVCLGNICRSPLAEGILQENIKHAGLNWTVDSAGTNGYHVGEPPHRLSRKVAKSRGIDISCQLCRRFVKEDFERFDKIYAMAADVIDEMKWIARQQYNPAIVDLLLNEAYPGENRDIPDPWYGNERGYHLVYDQIAEACNAIITNYRVASPANTPRNTI